MALDISDLLLVLLGGLLTILGGLLQSWIAESQFRKQLAKPAMRKLFLIATDRKAEPEEWSERMLKFLNSFESGFVPMKIQKKALKLVYEMDDKYTEAYPEKRHPLTDEDAQKIIDDWEKEYRAMSDQEKAETNFGGWFLQNKVELGKTILKEMSGEKPLD
jgi:hypothetical protein